MHCSVSSPSYALRMEDSLNDSPTTVVEPFRRLACDRCHKQKLRCSRDKNGCARCIKAGTRCLHSISTPGGRPRGSTRQNTTSHNNSPRPTSPLSVTRNASIEEVMADRDLDQVIGSGTENGLLGNNVGTDGNRK